MITIELSLLPKPSGSTVPSPTTRRTQWFVGLGLLLSATLGGCDCGDQPGTLTPIEILWVCQDQGRRPGPDDTACPKGQRFVKGECAAERCDADEALGANCCPGTLCTEGGVCQVRASHITPCTENSECPEGQACLQRDRISDTSNTCGFLPVNGQGECEDGEQVFNQRCIVGLPCDGHCPSGAVCNIDTNRCESTPNFAGVDHGCDQQCGATEILVYSDPDSMLFEQCCEVTCHCATLPAILPGNWGRFSDMVMTEDGITVSAYDATHGDLVVATAPRQTDAGAVSFATLDYIDGVPAEGVVTGDPDGPRQGISAAGPDVGLHTAIALSSSGDPRIVYRNLRTEDGMGGLKYAAYDGMSETWTVSTIDEAMDTAFDPARPADVGEFADLFIDSHDIAHVSYFARRITDGGVIVSTPLYARAQVAAPSGPDDWTRAVVEPVASCRGLCAAGERCVEQGGVPECLPESADAICSLCACDHACVEASAGAACLPELAPVIGHPCGGNCATGSACVSDAVLDTVCLPEQDPSLCTVSCGSDEVCVLADNAPTCRIATPFSGVAGLPYGVGLFTSILVRNDMVHIAYYDHVRRHLRGAVALFATSEDPSAGFATAPVGMCDPVEDAGQHASMTVAPDGNLWIAYQSFDGEILQLYTGADFFTGDSELVDDGMRQGEVHLVGSSARVAFNTAGMGHIVYADQTSNDVLMAVETVDGWEINILISEGAVGSFSRVVFDGDTDDAYVSTYLRQQDNLLGDTSKLVLHKVETAPLP